MQGAYSLFLVTTLPLFIVQSTSPLLDVPLAITISLGFLFFCHYLRGGDEKDLKTAIVFFTITCFIKNKGEFAGLGGMSACVAAVFFHSFLRKKRPHVSTLLFLLPVTLYFLVKRLYVSLYWMSKDTVKIVTKVIESSSEPVKELANYSFDSKLDIFLYSAFISGNQGLIFFILAATLLYNLKDLLSSRKVLEFVFIAVLITAVYFKMVVTNVPLDALSSWIHRYLMVPALLSAIWIPSLWYANRPSTDTDQHN